MNERYLKYMADMKLYHQNLSQRNYETAISFLEKAIYNCDCHFTLEFLSTLHKDLSYKIKESNTFWGKLRAKFL